MSDDLSARLRDLVRGVGVERMSPASIDRRVRQRDRHRGIRRSIASAAMVTTAVFLVIAGPAGGGGPADRVVTGDPVVPASAPHEAPTGGPAPAQAPPDSTLPPPRLTAPTAPPTTAVRTPKPTAPPATVDIGKAGAKRAIDNNRDN